ncbi:MAG: tRNA glutamyl-Q(34) synthetase GluQRS [Desulfovibrio sp.]|nr:tRNA glutamyl-Q(34) synthetase GluQRS [Desulfovibrio sp.]
MLNGNRAPASSIRGRPFSYLLPDVSAFPGLPRGRLAPSPTGCLHLGNAWSFLLCWLALRSAHGSVILRMEDIDPQRSRPEYASAIMQDLRWLGLDWDEGPDIGGPCVPYFQKERIAAYEAAIAALEAGGMVYPCFCTRKELRSLAGAPHIDDIGAPYPGTCRNLSKNERERFLLAGHRASLRLRCPEEPVAFVDQCMGPQRFRLEDCGGDFALRRSDGVIAYQLAVAVDDALMGVTQVIRGRDILFSTPRQICLLGLLGCVTPTYAHIPLILDEEGERLAKRHKSLSLRELRLAGAAPERIVALLGRLAGIWPSGAPARPGELIPFFSLDKIPSDDVVISRADIQALLA